MFPDSMVLEGLNGAQREAVDCLTGPLLVIAGAGSGKTRVITRRIARMIECGLAADTILAVTFTNKAAREMLERVHAMIGRVGVTVCTFHAFGARFLRDYGDRLGRSASFSLYDRADSESAIKACLDELGLDRESNPPRDLIEIIAGYKTRLLGPAAARDEAVSDRERDAARVFELYERKLAEADAFDFDDLIAAPVTLLEGDAELRDSARGRWRHLLVDEYQDVNEAQYRLVMQLAGPEANVCVTGDPDQCIYAWRGADISYILGFQQDFPQARVVRLEQNYRSVNTILDAASAVIRFNRGRDDKRLWSERPRGEPILIRRVLDEVEEARAVVTEIARLVAGGARKRDIAVLYRLNSLTLPLERAFIAAGLPYQVLRGLEFFKRKEVKDLVAWLRFLLNPRDRVSLGRIINTPPRGLGDKTVAQLDELAARSGLATGEFLLDQRHWRGALPARAARALETFVTLVRELMEARDQRPSALVTRVVEKSGFLEALEKSPRSAAGSDPVGNLQQLISQARDFEMLRPEAGIGGFLEEVALFSDQDALQTDRDRVALMTLHAAKGLEFKHAFIIGMDAEVFPHPGLRRDGDEEEERRLFYVGLTRAMDSLALFTTEQRNRFGRTETSRPSIFLTEIPAELTRVVDDVSGGPADDLDRRVEYEAEEGIQVRKGARVQHASFGPGVVVEVSGRGEKARVTVDFERAGKKKLMLRYAGLSPLDDWA
ncbi:MAG: UvrD-helicase domain-containing protein [Planctomycetes bacterium]|nr:UvrD-helicase domain-containing protein [Planctomycetota bacterium]